MQYGHINIDPEIMSDTPVFAGTRVPIKNMFDWFINGDSVEDFIDDFDSVSKEAAVSELEIVSRLLTSPEVLQKYFAE